MRTVPRPGDRVVAPVGDSEVEGVVTYVSSIFDPPEVQVEYRFEDDEGYTERNLFPIDVLRPVAARAV